MIIKRYTAAFLIPIGANKILGENGWEFESPKRLPKEVVEQLISALRLDFIELYSGIEKFVGDNIGMSIFLDDHNEVENIYFQVSDDSLKVLTELCQHPQMSSNAEMFVP
jgi:hypothetical protein